MRLKLLLLAMCALLASQADAQSWTIYKPGNTGIGGNLVDSFRLDPEDRPWIGARYPVQWQGGVSRFDGVGWTNFSNVDALMPSPLVHSIAFATGARYFGTNVGLVKHYGTHYDLFSEANAPLPKSEIKSVQVAPDGSVYMVYYDPRYVFTGVAKFDGTNWSVWKHDANLGFPTYAQLGRLAIAPDGKVYVGANASTIARWNGTSWTRFKPGLDAVGPFQPYLGKDGRIWVVTSKDVRVLEGSVWQTKPLPPYEGHDWMSFEALPNGSYYMGSWQGLLAKSDASGWSWVDVDAQVAEIQATSTGEIWWSSLRKLHRMTGPNTWQVFDSANTGISEYFTNSISFDTSGRLWVGTSGGGACSFDGVRWRGFNPYNSGSEPWAMATDYVPEILGASDGSVWAALGDSVARFDGTKWTRFGYGFMKNDIAENNRGKIFATWDINTAKGFAWFDGSTFLRRNLAGAPTYCGEPTDIFADGANIYLASYTGLLTNETGTWQRIDLSALTKRDDTIATCVVKGVSGDLWVGTNHGLGLRRAGVWNLFTRETSGLPANMITSIALRPDGLLAVGAFQSQPWPYVGGVALYNGEAWRTFVYGNSLLQHQQVDDVQFDRSGNLWIVSQSEGIAKIDLSNGVGHDLKLLRILPDQVGGGVTTTGQVWLTGPAPAGGAVIKLAAGASVITLAGQVTVPEGAWHANFQIRSRTVINDVSAVVYASRGPVTRSASIRLQVNDALYYGDDAPLTMTAGSRADVMVSYRNSGSSTWTDGAGFRLASKSPDGNQVFGVSRMRLNPLLSAAPGELGNFMARITAPSVPGTYTWQWQPYLIGSGYFGAVSPVTTIIVVAAGNASEFVSEEVPARVQAGSTFTASITMKNIGTNQWTSAAGYQLNSVSPANNKTWGRSYISMNSTHSISAGETCAMSETFTAPTSPGEYVFQWRMNQKGAGFFGPSTPGIKIVVY